MSKGKKLIIFLVAAVLVLAGTSFYFFWHSRHNSSSSGAVEQSEANALAAKVGRLMILPTDEVPTIATVSDPSKLSGQPFFQNAKVGDKVLIYTNAKLAVLYDPSVNKIVTIAPINTNGGAANTPASAGGNNSQF